MNFAFVINLAAALINFYAYSLTGDNVSLVIFLACGFLAVINYRAK